MGISRQAVVALLATAAVATGGVLATAGTVDAHHPEVDVSCTSTAGMIRVRAVAWDTPNDDERINDRVEIRFDGRVVHTGEFTRANGFQFTFDHDVSGATRGIHIVRATSVNGWGPDGADPAPVGPGAYREAAITLPCATWPTTPPDVVTPPQDQVLGATDDAKVLGATVTRPDVAQPVPVAPRLAG